MHVYVFDFFCGGLGASDLALTPIGRFTPGLGRLCHRLVQPLAYSAPTEVGYCSGLCGSARLCHRLVQPLAHSAPTEVGYCGGLCGSEGASAMRHRPPSPPAVRGQPGTSLHNRARMVVETRAIHSPLTWGGLNRGRGEPGEKNTYV